jgi:ABC-type lipoprotein release transport system permease subunit
VSSIRTFAPVCAAFIVLSVISVSSLGLPDILLSRQLLDAAGVHIGDVVTLAIDEHGSGATAFKVVGSYEPTPDPMKFSAKRLEARLHLPDLIGLTSDHDDPSSAETVQKISIALVDPREASSVATKLATRSLGLVARPTMTSTDDGEIFAVIDRFHRAIAVVTVVGSTAFLLALMVIRAEERRDIVGILRLIGIPPRAILAEVLIEGLLIAIGGALFGVLVATLGQSGINHFFQWRYDTTLRFVKVTIPIAVQSVAFAVPLGVVAGLAASWTLLRRDVVGLIRR